MFVSLFLLICLTLLSLHLLMKLFSKQKSYHHHHHQKLPLGNMGSLPFLGETLAFLKPHNSNVVGAFLQERCIRYGRVFKSHIFGSPTIVSCDLELNKFILQNEDKLFQTSYPKAIHGILGKYSLLLVSGDLHKKLRSVVVSFVGSSKSRKKFLECAEKMVISMIDSWNDRREIVFFKEAKKFTLSLMVKHVLNIETSDSRASLILEDFETYMKGFISLPIYVPGTSYFKAVKARERLSSTVSDIIKERLEIVVKDGHGHQNNDQEEAVEDFLDLVLAKKDLSEEERLGIVLDILLGGYETTATLMALIVYFVSHAPHVFDKLKEEHSSIRERKKDNEPLNWEDYKKMKFTYHVTCEAMRCGNVVKFVHRKALQDVKFKEILIPSGWKVLPIFTAVHIDHSLHDNPHEFNPWRWTDKDMRKKVTPFGGGPRLCPGADLAKVVIGFFIHHFVLNYRWKTKEDETPLAYPYVEFRQGLILEIEPTSTSNIHFRKREIRNHLSEIINENNSI